MLLEPLPETDARDLLHNLIGPARLDDHVAARILAIAEGNPLFVEEIVAMLIDDDILRRVGVTDRRGRAVRDRRAADDPGADRRPARPARRASAQSSRPPRSRARNSPANVSRGWSIPVASDSLDVHLRALVRKDLIRPVGATEESFRFRHQLIRDGAYEGMPKQLRADLHERFAERLSVGSPAVPVADELLGHHLERAVLLRRELGATEAATTELAGRASTYLRAAGRRAAQRDDPAAVRLLERALALTPRADPRRSSSNSPPHSNASGIWNAAPLPRRPRLSSRVRTATAGPPSAPAR